MVYKQFKSNNEIESFFNEINNHINVPVENWFKEDGLVLYGCYYDEDNTGLFYKYLFVFGKTISPTTLPPLNDNTIFSKLRRYGSSKKYKGLKDISGHVLLDNNYDDIDFFYEINDNDFFIVRKGTKKGIYKFESSFNNNLLKNIVQPQFDDFFDAGEYTWGYIKDGKVGFMSLEGNIITEAQYRQIPDYNQFLDGRALVCLSDPNGVEHYINHYGNTIGYPIFDLHDEHTLGTEYYPYGDLPDTSDAFEGEESSYWNID